MIGNGTPTTIARNAVAARPTAAARVDHAAADADHRRCDERHHGSAEAADDPLDDGHVAVLDVDAAHHAQQHEAGQRRTGRRE